VYCASCDIPEWCDAVYGHERFKLNRQPQAQLDAALHEYCPINSEGKHGLLLERFLLITVLARRLRANRVLKTFKKKYLNILVKIKFSPFVVVTHCSAYRESI
jgi:hypothetical protein